MRLIEPSAPSSDHPLVVAVRERQEPVEVLRVVQNQLARASAQLEFMALHAEHFSVEDARAVTRRARGLRRFAELVIAEQRVIGTGGLDPDSALGRLVFEMLVGRVAKVANDVLDDGTAAQLMTRIQTEVETEPDLRWP